MKRKLLFIAVIMIFITAAAAVLLNIIKQTKNLNRNSIAEENRLQVVTTFYPVYLIGLNLFENMDEVEVKSLTRLDTGCLHDYQLTTQDMKNISNADILVINGGGMEGFMKDIADNYPDLTIIDASNKITLYEDNPHIWLDPQLYIKQIENVRDSVITYLSTDFSKNMDVDKIKNKLINNAEAYISKVSDIDSQLNEIKENYLAAVEGANKPKAVIFHDSFAYIANRIGLPVAYSIPLDSDTTLSAEDIANIIDDVKDDDIGYLFTEEQYSDSVAKRIEAETDAREYIIDSAVTGDGSKTSYLDAMEKNINVLKTALLK
jgi:zinc transport system substrate-binding protein